MSSLHKNLSYQTAYQILSTCVPLITAPYLSRVLGADALGVFSFTNSNVRYFTLFALLGVAQYGMREIARVKGEGKQSVSKTFWEIYLFQLVASLLVIGAYVLFCRFVYKEHQVIAIVQIFTLFSNALDISWLYFGLEKFKVTVTRNLVIKILTTISFFLFIKSPDDLFVYTLISSVSLLISSLILWVTLRGCVDFIKVSGKGVRQHIRPNLILFIPSIAASVYHVMDKTMLGFFSEMTEGGYYHNADKVVNIPLTVINGCCTVIMANISSLYGQNRAEEAEKLQCSVLNFGICAVGAMSFGVAAIAKEFIPIFFGAGFEKCVPLVQLFSIVMVFKAVSNLTRSAFLIPQRLDAVYIYAVFSGVAVNLVFNTLFIVVFRMGSMGATLGTLIAEGIVCIVQIFLLWRHNKKTVVLNEIIKDMVYVFFGSVMLGSLLLLEVHFAFIGFIGLAIKVVIGAGIYIILCGVYWKYSKRMPSIFADLLRRFK